MEIVIVGGVAGGATAAARIRRLDENAKITIFERTGYISYANCGLPYYIGGEITDKKELTLQTAESFKKRFNINVFVNHEVLKVHKENNSVMVKNLETGEIFEKFYDKLLLSPGAKAVIPNILGVDSKFIFTLRTVEDTFKIYDYIKQNSVTTATIIGGGFIGLEMLENLARQQIKVVMVQKDDHVLSPIDKDMASLLHTEIRKNGINLILNGDVVKFSEVDRGIITELKNGDTIESQIVILCIGVVPETTLAKDAGLKLGIKDSILVDENMRTSYENIYAVGDAVEIKHIITGNKAVISLAGPANKQGRIAGDNICGIKSKYKGSLGTSVLKLFSLTVGMVGLNERQLKTMNVDYLKVILSPSNHATYYPGASTMTMKVLFEKSTEKLLGAQIVGEDGVDKRIDVIATAMFNNMKASELKDLDLAYAPPYSSAKDPVNMAGFIIENLVTGKVKQFYIEDIENLLNDKGATLIDARTKQEYNRGSIQGFKNIPLDDLRNNLDSLDKNKRIYVMCQSGLRSYIATRILMQNGFDAYNFAGGYRYYSLVKCCKEQIGESYACGLEKNSDKR